MQDTMPSINIHQGLIFQILSGSGTGNMNKILAYKNYKNLAALVHRLSYSV